jgi:hypothetical protein
MVIAACGSSEPTPTTERTPDVTTITDAGQREAAAGKPVRIIGVQTRTKVPTVCGVDVDGDYELSDKMVMVTGRLEKRVVDSVDPHTANRGTGTFYSVIDETTGRLARPVPHDPQTLE